MHRRRLDVGIAPETASGNETRPRAAVLLALAGLAIAAALATVLTAHFVFPDGTANLDEAAYQSQANTLAAGHLTLPARTHDPVFRPFLSGIRGDRIVFKYQPAWPALIAASDEVFGSSLFARVLLSIAGVLAVVWLAWELVRDEWVALIAGFLIVASPFVWVQSASLLGYQLSFVLGAAASAALLRAQRTHGALMAVTAGALGGLLALHRPYDAVLLLTPALVYCAWRAVRDRSIVRFVVWVAAGAAPLLVVFCAYNWSVMGSPLRSAFNVSGNLDRFGFGWRASFVVSNTGHTGQVDYTVGEAFATLRHVVAVYPRFVAFAPAVVICLGVAVVRRRRDPRLWLLVAMMLTVLVGYFFWWGVDNAFRFRLERALGPFYHYPALAALCIAAAWGVRLLRTTAARVAVVVIGVVWTGVASAAVLHEASQQGAARSAELARLTGAGRRLVFEPPQFPNDPYLRVANDAHLAGTLVVGTSIPGERLATVDRFTGRTAYEIRNYRKFNDPFGPQLGDRITLVVVRAPRVNAVAVAAPQPGKVATLYARIGDGAPEFSTGGAGTLTAGFTLEPSMLPADGSVVEVAVGRTSAPAGTPPPISMTGDWVECRFEARRAPKGVEVLTPCAGWHHYEFPDGATATSREDLTGVLEVAIRPA
ncbi:MAG TPA: glycosyltransferase family 39 protein [Acidimicrobiia bacterium]|nr:glycosyltransferase family 39 protein [Acidimicrobiia bacterium]